MVLNAKYMEVVSVLPGAHRHPIPHYNVFSSSSFILISMYYHPHSNVFSSSFQCVLILICLIKSHLILVNLLVIGSSFSFQITILDHSSSV